MPHTEMRVLLVEDDDDYARLLMTELATFAPKVEITRVRTLHDATAVLTHTAADVVLLDLSLPDSDGLETVERMQQTAPAVAIVVLTANADEKAGVEAVHRGAQDYLIKSDTEPRVLTRALRYARERAAFRRALAATEEQLRQAHKMEAVGRLAGGIAHDFNNVLTAIFGYADLLLEQFTDDDPRRGDVAEIRRSAERAAALTRQLLAFSRKQVMQPRTLDLLDVVQSLEKLLARLVGEDITLRISSAGDLWLVRADPGQIEQVLMNLCANARDAMPEGGTIEIYTENREVDADQARDHPGLHSGFYVTLSVSDSGHGMPDHVQRHIFEPFFTTKEIGKGTGLGLATVYGIVKQSGGSVYAESDPGVGTRFTIYLPRVEAPVTT